MLGKRHDNGVTVGNRDNLLTLFDARHSLKHELYPILYLIQSQLNKPPKDDELTAKTLKLANLVNALLLSLLVPEQGESF